MSGSVVAFLDDDAEAEADWLRRLCEPYAEPDVVGVGGLVMPEWQEGRPPWFAAEVDWVVGCSHRGLPTGPARIRNPIGANMSFRAQPLRAAGGFVNQIGRIGSRPVGCEETEAAIRISQRHPDTRIFFQPGAVVRHHVPPHRALGVLPVPVLVGRTVQSGGGAADRSEPGARRRTKLRHADLAAGRSTRVAEAVSRMRPVAATRAAAIVAGLAITTAGYATGRVRSLGARQSTPQRRIA